MIRRNIKRRMSKAILSNNVLEQIVSESLTAEKEEQYTKTEINRMSTAELQELASKEGIAGAEEMTGAELKKLLIEKFGL